MISHDIETYRAIRVRMVLEETPTHWTCEITFERTDLIDLREVPPGFWKDADKYKVSALNFSIAMQHNARALIDEWLTPRNS
jgi:hypothetical protein